VEEQAGGGRGVGVLASREAGIDEGAAVRRATADQRAKRTKQRATGLRAPVRGERAAGGA